MLTNGHSSYSWKFQTVWRPDHQSNKDIAYEEFQHLLINGRDVYSYFRPCSSITHLLIGLYGEPTTYMGCFSIMGLSSAHREGENSCGENIHVLLYRKPTFILVYFMLRFFYNKLVSGEHFRDWTFFIHTELHKTSGSWREILATVRFSRTSQKFFACE
jgi:hypothetical protein